jgi:hypothetical protein
MILTILFILTCTKTPVKRAEEVHSIHIFRTVFGFTILKPEHTHLSSVVNAIIQRFGTPERVCVVKLQQIDALAGVRVTAGVHFLVAVAPVDGNDDRSGYFVGARLGAAVPALRVFGHFTVLVRDVLRVELVLLVLGLGDVHGYLFCGGLDPLEEEPESDVVRVGGELPEQAAPVFVRRYADLRTQENGPLTFLLFKFTSMVYDIKKNIQLTVTVSP